MERFARIAYSRSQVFNADDSLVLVVAGNGAVHVLSAVDFSHLATLESIGGVDGEPQWHPDHPRRLRYFPRSNRAAIAELELNSGAERVLVDFGAGRLPWPGLARVTTRWEGSPSADGRLWCLMAYDDEDAFIGVFSYDMADDRVLAHRAMAQAPDHIGTSASGRHCVIAHEREHGGTRVWDIGLTRSRLVHATSEHSDLAIGADGEDLLVFVDYDTDGVLVAIDLDSGQRTALLDTYLDGSATAYHVSARSFARPGWAVVSTYAGRGAPQWLHDRVIAVELRENPRILQLAQHRSRYTSYWTAPMATANRDLSRVLFNSNWGSGREEDMDVYSIEVPAHVFQPP